METFCDKPCEGIKTLDSRDQSENRQVEGPTGKGSKCRYRTVLVLLVLPIGGYADMQKCQGI